MQHLQSALGVLALLGFAFAISENRRAVDWRSAGAALLVTFATALLLLEVPQIKTGFALVNRAVNAVAEATQAGTSFVFGYVGGGPLPFPLTTPGAEFVLAFQALPVVLNHLRLFSTGCPDLRNPEAVDRLNGAFDFMSHTVDVRRRLHTPGRNQFRIGR